MNHRDRLKSWVKAKIKRLTATTSKTAIAVLSLVILFLIASVVLFRPARSFCFGHPGIIIVVVAVAGEVICDWNRKKSLKEKLKKFFGMLLVGGLLLEVAEAIASDKKVAIANLEAQQAYGNAGKANERAAEAFRGAITASFLASSNELQVATLTSNNLALQAMVLEMETRTSWRRITPEDKNRFIGLTKNLFKFPVRVRMGSSASAEVQGYARKIREMLNDAGFIETNKVQAIAEWPAEMNLVYTGNGVTEMPSVVFVNNLSVLSAAIDLTEANMALKSWYSTNVSIPTTFYVTNTDSAQKAFVTMNNGKPMLNIPIPSPGAAKFNSFMQVQMAFNNIGITTDWITMTNIPNGVCEVFIDPKF